MPQRFANPATARTVALGCALAAGVGLSFRPSEAGALPLFARETGESCVACHADSKATDKIGGFVPGLSVNNGWMERTLRPAPAYVLLSALLRSPGGDYGSSLGFVGRGAEPRNLTVDGYWLPVQGLRLGAQYTIFSRPEAASDAGYDPARRDPGTLFLYMRHAY